MESKWIGISKSFISTVTMGMAALVAGGVIPVGTDVLTSNVIAGGFAIMSAVLEFLHQRKMGNTVLPK